MVEAIGIFFFPRRKWDYWTIGKDAYSPTRISWFETSPRFRIGVLKKREIFFQSKVYKRKTQGFWMNHDYITKKKLSWAKDEIFQKKVGPQ